MNHPGVTMGQPTSHRILIILVVFLFAQYAFASEVVKTVKEKISLLRGLSGDTRRKVKIIPTIFGISQMTLLRKSYTKIFQ
jgi:hypothetical protein